MKGRVICNAGPIIALCVIGRIDLLDRLKDVILFGQIIESYPEDKYGPSCLIYGTTETGKILHVQCSIEPVWIITVYDPTLKPEEWNAGFKRRR